MDPDQKELIEKAAKSDYLDKVLEIQIQKKATEILQRKKWLAIFIAGLFVLLTGYNLYDVLLRTPRLMEGLENRLMGLSDSLDELNATLVLHKMQMEDSKSQLAQFEKAGNLWSLLSQKYIDFFELRFGQLNSEIDKNQKESTILKAEIDTRVNELKTIKKEIADQTNALQQEMHGWQEEKREIKKLSSTVYAYVERGAREPDKWGFRPTYIDLPFSSKSLQITFNKAEKRKEKSKMGDFKERIKLAEITITLLDSLNKEITTENMLLKESRPMPIPGTDHEIMAQFVYMPPNPIIMIPDFIILAISPQKESVKNMQFE